MRNELSYGCPKMMDARGRCIYPRAAEKAALTFIELRSLAAGTRGHFTEGRTGKPVSYNFRIFMQSSPGMRPQNPSSKPFLYQLCMYI